jgi:hypothetical protein
MNARISTTDTPEQYHAVKAVSNSGIGLLLDCPARFKAWRDGGVEKETESMLHGNVFHCLSLEPEAFSSRYAKKHHSGTTKGGKAEKEEAERAGLVQVKIDMYHSASEMAGAVRNHKLIGALFRQPDAMREVSIYWLETVSGIIVPCKARIDWRGMFGKSRVAIDLKSTTDASPEELKRSIYNYGYHRQGAWYQRALQAAGIDVDAFVLVAVEKEEPYIVTPTTIAEPAIQKGTDECNEALEIYAKCETENDWPCYTEEIITLDLPPYAYRSTIA